SPSNFVYNHIGHFAAAGEAVCKALFLGGVTRRFPTLNLGFLEGGVAWACNLYADLIGHWDKRSLSALEETNPANLDSALMAELAERYAPGPMAAALRRGEGLFVAEGSAATAGLDDPRLLDDFAACGIERAEDIRDLFVERLYFG